MKYISHKISLYNKSPLLSTGEICVYHTYIKIYFTLTIFQNLAQAFRLFRLIEVPSAQERNQCAKAQHQAASLHQQVTAHVFHHVITSL